jgi:multiple sugar transport system substrate-binding protein
MTFPTQVRRRDALSAAASAGAALLAACGGGAPSGAPRPDPGGPPLELKLWGPPAAAEPGATLSQQLAELRQERPRLQVELEPVTTTGTDVTKAIAVLAAGTGPDVFYLGRWLTAQFAAHKAIASVERLAARAGRALPLDDFYPRLITESRWRGELYGVPFVAETRGLYLNRTHLAEAGLSADRPPATWDQLNQAAARLLARGPDGQPARLGYVPGWGNPPTYLAWMLYLWQLGGDLLTPDNKKLTPDLTQKGAAALEAMAAQTQQMGGGAVVDAFSRAATLPQGTDQFSAGRLSLQYHGASVMRLYNQVAGLDYAVAPLPLPPGGKRVTFAPGPSLALSAGSKEPEAAWQVIEFLETPVQLVRYNVANSSIPPRRSAASSKDFQATNPRLSFFVDELAHGRWVPVVAGIQDMFLALDEVVTPAIYGRVAPREAVQNVLPRIQTILDQNAPYL